MGGVFATKPHIRFCAGALLIRPKGHALGTLCVLDYVPRELSDQQREALRVLSSQAITQIELRKTKTDLPQTSGGLSTVRSTLAAQRLLSCEESNLRARPDYSVLSAWTTSTRAARIAGIAAAITAAISSTRAEPATGSTPGTLRPPTRLPASCASQ